MLESLSSPHHNPYLRHLLYQSSQTLKVFFLNHVSSSADLMDPIQPRTVHSDLIIHLVSLADDTIDVLVLRVDFLAHRAAQSTSPSAKNPQTIIANGERVTYWFNLLAAP
jgi:hypothetical protein